MKIAAHSCNYPKSLIFVVDVVAGLVLFECSCTLLHLVLPSLEAAKTLLDSLSSQKKSVQRDKEQMGLLLKINDKA